MRQLRRLAKHLREQRIAPIEMYILRNGKHDILFAAREDFWIPNELLMGRVLRGKERTAALRSIREDA
jgi:hypothetical protein